MPLSVHSTEEAPSTMRLAKKILAVMATVGPVQKDKRNDFHNYRYASDEAIVTALRTALIANNLIIRPSQKSCSEIIQKNAKGEEQTLTKLEVEFTITDVDSGETERSTFFGYGADKIDKGVYKAMTGAEKYFLLKTFLIATPDDPESGQARQAMRRPVEPAPRPATPPPAKAAAPVAPPAPPKEPTITSDEWSAINDLRIERKMKPEELTNHLLRLGYNSGRDVPKSKLEALRKWIKGELV